jgi:hypothetical protein
MSSGSFPLKSKFCISSAFFPSIRQSLTAPSEPPVNTWLFSAPPPWVGVAGDTASAETEWPGCARKVSTQVYPIGPSRHILTSPTESPLTKVVEPGESDRSFSVVTCPRCPGSVACTPTPRSSCQGLVSALHRSRYSLPSSAPGLGEGRGSPRCSKEQQSGLRQRRGCRLMSRPSKRKTCSPRSICRLGTCAYRIPYETRPKPDPCRFDERSVQCCIVGGITINSVTAL